MDEELRKEYRRIRLICYEHAEAIGRACRDKESSTNYMISLLEKLSNFCQESAEKIRISTGEVRLGESQNIAPAELESMGNHMLHDQ